MKRRIAGGLLAALLCLSGSAAAFGADSTAVPKDVAGGQYEMVVRELIEKGIVSGYEDGTFRPMAPVSRAEACVMVVTAAGASAADLLQAKTSGFSDISAEHSWAAKYIDLAVERGVVNGYAENVFRPEDRVTYEEMAAMILNAMGYDASSLSGEWPANYVNKAKELGIFTGLETVKIGEFPANRGDVARMIYYAITGDGAQDDEGEVFSGDVGDHMDTAFFDFTVKSIYAADTLAGYEPNNPDYQFIVADVTVKNTFDEAIPVGNYDFNIYWEGIDDGAEENRWAYEKFMAGMYPDDIMLARGESVSGKLVFEAPKTENAVGIYYTEIYEDNYEGNTHCVWANLN